MSHASPSIPVLWSITNGLLSESLTLLFPSQPPPSPSDLTSQYIYTIDDAATTEIDDGLAVRRESHGDLRVWVHVADPTAHVRLDDALDQEARRRARTLYLPTRIVPMFPRQLADGPFSLR